MEEKIRLTQFSKGAGCGCKIAPQVLQEILKTSTPVSQHKNLIIGNVSNDDAAVYDIGDDRAIISTTDFFMPIVDDAQSFGKIASANAISDVYAMGGKPLMAIAVLGWPIEKLSTSLFLINSRMEEDRDAFFFFSSAICRRRPRSSSSREIQAFSVSRTWFVSIY